MTGTLVLAYHAIGPGDSPLFVSTEAFEAHLDALAAGGWQPISLADLFAHLEQGSVPKKSVVLTFDDGFESFHQAAWPRLRARGFEAAVFIASNHSGGTNDWPGRRTDMSAGRLMNWEQIAGLAAEGVEIGSHTHTHRPLVRLSPEEIIREFTLADREIAQRTGHKPQFLAYPYGAVNQAVIAAAGRHYRGALGTELGFVSANSNPHRLPRIDAYYLNPFWLDRLADPAFPAYLGIRQAMRRFRRWVRPDWKGEAWT